MYLFINSFTCVCIYIYAYIYIYIYMGIYMYICTCMHACMHACMHTYIHTCIHTHVCSTWYTVPLHMLFVSSDSGRPRENMVGANMVLAEYHQNTRK